DDRPCAERRRCRPQGGGSAGRVTDGKKLGAACAQSIGGEHGATPAPAVGGKCCGTRASAVAGRFGASHSRAFERERGGVGPGGTQERPQGRTEASARPRTRCP